MNISFFPWKKNYKYDDYLPNYIEISNFKHTPRGHWKQGINLSQSTCNACSYALITDDAMHEEVMIQKCWQVKRIICDLFLLHIEHDNCHDKNFTSTCSQIALRNMNLLNKRKLEYQYTVQSSQITSIEPPVWANYPWWNSITNILDKIHLQ